MGFSLSYRDVQELLVERGVSVDHSTIWRWVQRFAADLLLRLRPYLKPTNRSWRVDEISVRVKGRSCYLYRAVDLRGTTIDFFLLAFRDLEAAKSLFRRALRDGAHPQPRVINTDVAPTYTPAIPALQRTGVIRRRCRHRPVQYLNNILEQDHHAINRRVPAKQGFRAFGAARRVVKGYQAMQMMKKGQVGGSLVTMSAIASIRARVVRCSRLSVQSDYQPQRRNTFKKSLQHDPFRKTAPRIYTHPDVR